VFTTTSRHAREQKNSRKHGLKDQILGFELRTHTYGQHTILFYSSIHALQSFIHQTTKDKKEENKDSASFINQPEKKSKASFKQQQKANSVSPNSCFSPSPFSKTLIFNL